MSDSSIPLPHEFEQYAADRARRLASVDRERLPGSNGQYTAILQLAIIDAIRKALGAAVDACEVVRVTLRGDTIAPVNDVPTAFDIACDGCMSAINDLGGSDFSPVAMGLTPTRPYVMIRAHGVEFSPAMPMSDDEMDVLRRISHRMKSTASSGHEPPMFLRRWRKA